MKYIGSNKGLYPTVHKDDRYAIKQNNKQYKKKKSTIISENSDKPLADKNRHYVDKKAFLEALIEHKEKVNKAKEQGLPEPQPSNFIGECILKIAQGLGKKRNFAAYPFKDDMVSDSVVTCIRYLNNFDPAKSNNPFAYYTQICSYAFINRIKEEETQTYYKFKSTINSAMMGDIASRDSEDYAHVLDNLEFQNDYMEQFIESYEEKRKPKKDKKKGLENFIDDEDK